MNCTSRSVCALTCLGAQAGPVIAKKIRAYAQLCNVYLGKPSMPVNKICMLQCVLVEFFNTWKYAPAINCSLKENYMVKQVACHVVSKYDRVRSLEYREQRSVSMYVRII